MSSTHESNKRTRFLEPVRPESDPLHGVCRRATCIDTNIDEMAWYANISMQVFTDEDWSLLLTMLNQRYNYQQATVDPSTRTIYLQRLNKMSYIYILGVEKGTV